jgi:DNA-binding GntR family transcriptional regulator
MRLFGVFHPSFDDSLREHEEILDACEAGRAEEASRLMVAHLEHTARVVASGLARPRSQPEVQANG